MKHLLDVNAFVALELATYFAFITHDQDVSHMPSWAKAGRQTTDGHLVQLAKSKSAILATLDGRIPGAFVIPAPR